MELPTNFDALHGIMAAIIIYLLLERYALHKHIRYLTNAVDRANKTFDDLFTGITISAPRPTTPPSKPKP